MLRLEKSALRLGKTALGLGKTASATVAALVVAVAAAATSLALPPVADGSGAAITSTVSPSSASTTAQAASGEATSGGGRRQSEPVRATPTVLMIGRSAELNPHGGVARSFGCRAAASLGWNCVVRRGGAPAIPASAKADVIVVALVAGDDVARVTRLLGRLPSRFDRARLVLLGPTTAPARAGSAAGVAAAQRSARWRRLAITLDATFVDPAAAGWFAGPLAAGAFARGGQQLSPSGRTECAERLATTLKTVIEG